MSVSGSAPTSLAFVSRPLGMTTVIELAPSITWLLVRICPSLRNTTPEPALWPLSPSTTICTMAGRMRWAMPTTGSSGVVAETLLSATASGRTTSSMGRITVVRRPSRPPAVAMSPLANRAPIAPANRARLHGRASRRVDAAGAAIADGHGVTVSSEGCRQRRSSGWSQPPSGVPTGSSSSSPSSPFMLREYWRIASDFGRPLR